MKKVSIVFFLFLLGNSFAQNFGAKTKELSWADKNYFSSGAVGFLLDFYSSPGTPYQAVLTYYDEYTRVTTYDTVTYYKGIGGYSLVNLTYEARFNIANNKDISSLSIDVPFNVGFLLGSVAETHTSKSEFVFASVMESQNTALGLIFRVPLILSFNKGYHATYNNIEHKGYSLGIGIQNSFNVYTEPSEVNKVKKVWTHPVFRYAFKTDKIGMFHGMEVTAGYWNGWNLRMGFVYVFNYD